MDQKKKYLQMFSSQVNTRLLIFFPSALNSPVSTLCVEAGEKSTNFLSSLALPKYSVSSIILVEPAWQIN